eukprot:344074-Pyramimonas_sp.AAC.1
MGTNGGRAALVGGAGKDAVGGLGGNLLTPRYNGDIWKEAERVSAALMEEASIIKLERDNIGRAGYMSAQHIPYSSEEDARHAGESPTEDTWIETADMGGAFASLASMHLLQERADHWEEDARAVLGNSARGRQESGTEVGDYANGAQVAQDDGGVDSEDSGTVLECDVVLPVITSPNVRRSANFEQDDGFRASRDLERVDSLTSHPLMSP